MRNRTAQEKVLALEQQVLMLTKELKAQKVSSGPKEAPGSGAPLWAWYPWTNQMMCSLV